MLFHLTVTVISVIALRAAAYWHQSEVSKRGLVFNLAFCVVFTTLLVASMGSALWMIVSLGTTIAGVRTLPVWICYSVSGSWIAYQGIKLVAANIRSRAGE